MCLLLLLVEMCRVEVGVAGRRNADVRMVVQLSRRRRRSEERELPLLGVCLVIFMLVMGACVGVGGVVSVIVYLVGGC